MTWTFEIHEKNKSMALLSIPLHESTFILIHQVLYFKDVQVTRQCREKCGKNRRYRQLTFMRKKFK